jgi:hypothetical protein
MAEHAKMVSVGPQRRIVLPEVTWEGISEPGAYLEVGTGDLYRIPKEALPERWDLLSVRRELS